MVSKESVSEVFLPHKEDCLEYLRDHRWSNGVTYPHCKSAGTIKKGMTRKGAQRYQCKNYQNIFHDLTETLFAEHQVSVPEMFQIISKMEGHTTSHIYHKIDWTYKTVLDFVIMTATRFEN
jgi:transposase-like protein